jgi:hypothetical protein
VIAERDSVLAKLKKMSSSCLLGWCYSGSDSRGCQQLEAMRSICQAKRPEVPQLKLEYRYRIYLQSRVNFHFA